MLNLSYKDKPSDFEYYDNLSYDKRVFFDTKKVMQMIVANKAVADTEVELAMDYLAVDSGSADGFFGARESFGSSHSSRDYIIDYLLDEVPGNLRYLMFPNDSANASLDMDNVLEPLLNMGIAVPFLTNYMSFRRDQKASRDMRKRVKERFVDTVVPGISSLSYDWTHSLSGRLYTANDNVQNIKKTYLPCMRGQNDDYLLVWGDFDQIDLRVAYYTVLSESEEDDRVFNSCADKYEAMARIIDKRLGRDFNKERFDENRPKYKKGILARCYGQPIGRLIKKVGDKDFAVMLDKYYKSNKRYMAWYNDVVRRVNVADEVIVRTYFGNTRRISLADLSAQAKRIDRVINCPIQGTSNDIVMHMVNKTVRAFREQGIPEEKFRAYMVRHDEPLFMIHKSCLKYLPLIRRNTVIQVDDWGPVTMSFNVGKYYTVSENDKYAEFIGGEDIESGARIVPREKRYVPFDTHTAEGFQEEQIEYKDGTLTVGTEEYTIDTSKCVKYQIHHILACFALKKHTRSMVFLVEKGNPLDFCNMYVNSVNLIFREVGLDNGQ